MGGADEDEEDDESLDDVGDFVGEVVAGDFDDGGALVEEAEEESGEEYTSGVESAEEGDGDSGVAIGGDFSAEVMAFDAEDLDCTGETCERAGESDDGELSAGDGHAGEFCGVGVEAGDEEFEAEGGAGLKEPGETGGGDGDEEARAEIAEGFEDGEPIGEGKSVALDDLCAGGVEGAFEEDAEELDGDEVEEDGGEDDGDAAIAIEESGDEGPERAAEHSGEEGGSDGEGGGGEMREEARGDDGRGEGAEDGLARCADVEDSGAEGDSGGEAGENEGTCVFGGDDPGEVGADGTGDPFGDDAQRGIAGDPEADHDEKEGGGEGCEDEEGVDEGLGEFFHDAIPLAGIPIISLPMFSLVSLGQLDSVRVPLYMTRRRSERARSSSRSEWTRRTAAPLLRALRSWFITKAVAPMSRPRVGLTAMTRGFLFCSSSRARTAFC